MRAHDLDGMLKRRRIGQKRGDVLEEYARLRKIRYVANVIGQIHRRPFSGRGAGRRPGWSEPAYETLWNRATMSLFVRQATPADARRIVEFNCRLARET